MFVNIIFGFILIYIPIDLLAYVIFYFPKILHNFILKFYITTDNFKNLVLAFFKYRRDKIKNFDNKKISHHNKMYKSEFFEGPNQNT